MGKALNTKRKFLVILAFIVSAVFVCGTVQAKVTLVDFISDPNTITVKFDERCDFEEFRDSLENVCKEFSGLGCKRQVKFYNNWLFDLTIVFNRHLCSSLQHNDYVSRVKLYDIFARIVLGDFRLMGVVKDGVSADYGTISDKFREHILSRFAKVPTGGSGIIFHTDVPLVG